MYDFDDRDGYYEQDTYAGDRWGAWLDDTRVEYRAPHTQHDTASDFLPTQWREEVASGQEYRSYDEWAEAQAAYACEDCTEYAEAWATEQAERRAGC